MTSARGGIRFALLLLITAAAVATWGFIRFSPATPHVVTVERGMPAGQVADMLKQQGLIWSRWSFLAWVELGGSAGIRPGVYTLTPRQTGRQILERFRHGPPLMKITFPEGWTAKQMAAHLQSKNITDPEQFLQIVASEHHEGFLFPDTYFFQQSIPARDVVDRLVRRFHEVAPNDLEQQAKALHLSYNQLVTLASLVEKEARAPQERPIIAGVFLNRLRKHWRLESCATVEYALGNWKAQLTYKDLDVVSPYNTYRHFGLPPGPICNPGLAALQAAAHPAKTEMMFFVADGSGTHRFSQYYDQHLAVQKEIHKKK